MSFDIFLHLAHHWVHAFAPLAGVALEALTPLWRLYDRRPFGRPWHPVVYIGSAIAWSAGRLNNHRLPNSLLVVRGWLLILVLLFIALVLGDLILRTSFYLFGDGIFLVLALCFALFVSQRELHDRAAEIFATLDEGNLEEARLLLPALVGRDPDSLDEAGIRRAVLESLAENYSDGTVAPVFWGMLFGLPGLLFYKMVNTADSMIGYDNDTWRYLGRGAAKADDILSWIPARLTALLFLVGAPKTFLRNLPIVWRDAPRHRSMNAGWPEAAFATRINVALAGPRRYDGEWTSDGFMNEGATPAPSPSACQAGLRVYRGTCPLLWILMFFLLL